MEKVVREGCSEEVTFLSFLSLTWWGRECYNARFWVFSEEELRDECYWWRVRND